MVLENLYVSNFLQLPNCPYCGTARPTLKSQEGNSAFFTTRDHQGLQSRMWGTFSCSVCGGVVLISSVEERSKSGSTSMIARGGAETIRYKIISVLPEPKSISQEVPERPRHFLQDAANSLHASSASIMASASALDAMLKEKGYRDGDLYKRIKSAAENHLITESMAEWANHIRLEANNQRHADEEADLPTIDDAKRALEFALALAEYLYVLPARVNCSLLEAKRARK